jgi:hypothetical protein
MRLAAYVPLLLPVLLAVLARPISDRLHPRLATWLLTAAAVVLAACATLALGVLAASAAMRIPLVASLGRISMSVLGPGTAYQTAAGALAGVALGAGAVTATIFLIHRCRGLADAYSEARQLSGLAQPAASAGLPCSRTNEHTWPDSTTCIPRPRAWQQQSIRCCVLLPGRWNTPSSDGPTRRPPRPSANGASSRTLSGAPP